MIKTIFSTLTLSIAVFLSSCASPTPQSRIDKNPQAFASLSKKHQEAVSRGQIAKGMTKPAVFLAWGGADRISQGERNDKRYEKWIYTRFSPVYSNAIYSNVGYGFGRYGRYGRRRGPYHNYGFSPTLLHREVPRGSVTFINDRVDNWQNQVRR